MKIHKFYFFLILFALLINGCSERKETRLLIFTKTAGFEHKSIPSGVEALLNLGKDNKIQMDTTSNSSVFTEDNLKQYHAVVFLNTTGDVLDYRQQADFERYIQAGGGFVGIHSAADTEYHWPWYGKLVGGYFESHPAVQKASIKVSNTSHPSTKHLPENWERTDEWYNYISLNPDINVLASLDEDTYEGGKNGDDHPIIWYHEYDGGRAFYTGVGHTDESYSEPALLEHLLGGILWAAGEEDLDYTKATTIRVPEETHFHQVVLAEDLDEPTELAVINNGDVLIVERKGEIKIFKASNGTTKLAGKLEVHSEEEDGLMGVAVDPDFENNNWVYLYYSPAGAEPVNVLSRFVLKEDLIDMSSEKRIIEVPVQREECCHTGGSIAFDAQGNLFLSTGDNTNPFESGGYAPIDARAGRSSWDARRTAANTDDLRGKILRIHPEDDGTYTIPSGNLFTEDSSIKGRPEIYVMGNRNPYRISVDKKTNFLYWGEVGPDAGKDSIRGPKGHDEINQATGPGNFGWPMFVGDNKAYRQYDFAAEELGELFNPSKPGNTSVNNTGSELLPPAQPAFIWYPYEPIQEFPILGEGGRTAMAGPVFYSDMYNDSKVKFPEYYNGKFFIYEWMRNWILAVTMDENGDLVKMEPFLPNMELVRPMDMDFGADGAMYILEYGQDWFKKNEKARLVRVEYSEENHSPQAVATVLKNEGAAPFTASFSAKESIDRDKDEKLSYAWSFTGSKIQSTEVEPSYTFSEPGTYEVVLVVTDSKGARSITKTEVKVGEATEAEISGAEMGHERPAENFLAGKERIENSDCRACHAVDKTVIGPSYLEIANRYKDDDKAPAMLVEKILLGGRGNWGDRPMAPHPQLSEEEAGEMVEYILSLKENELK